MSPELFALRLIRFLQPPYFYKTLELDENLPLDRQPNCPSDSTRLETLATLVANGGSPRMRIGCCPLCGYVGFMERPTLAWLQNFYRDTWDAAAQVDIAAEVEKYRSRPGRAPAAALFDRFALDKNRPVLEIGSGYGRELQGFVERGFRHVVGVEPSRHRAEVTRQAYHLPVVNAPFESETIELELEARAPFGLIFSQHVLEHTHAPSRVIGLCSRLQQHGDYLLLEVPNVLGSVSGLMLFYLPHLHNFSPLSLALLLARHGYAVVDDSGTSHGRIRVLAQKVGEVRPAPGPSVEYPALLTRKFAAGLGLGVRYRASHRILWWFRATDLGGQTGVWAKPLLWWQWLFISKVSYKYKYKKELVAAVGLERYRQKTQHVAGMVGAAVESVPRRYTPATESPLEIQFARGIQLLYK